MFALTYAKLIDYFQLDKQENLAHELHLLNFYDSQLRLITQNFAIFSTPKQMNLLNKDINLEHKFIDDFKISVNNIGTGIAMWVTLTTTAQGYFDINSFMLPPNKSKIVEFFPNDVDGSLHVIRNGRRNYSRGSSFTELRRSLRIEHLSLYI